MLVLHMRSEENRAEAEGIFIIILTIAIKKVFIIVPIY